MRRFTLFGGAVGLYARGKIATAALVACGAALALVAGGTGTAAGPGGRAGSGSPALPDTPAARRVSAYLEAGGSGDRERMAAFVREGFAPAMLERAPLQRHVQLALGLHRDRGGLELREVIASRDTEVTVLLEGRLTEELLRLTVAVEPGAPHRITSIVGRPAEIPPTPGRRRPDGEIARELSGYLERLAKAERFSGAVLVAREGKPFFRKAYGLASRAWSAPNRVDTRFNLGSMNKMITAIAVARLVEEGKLAFSDPVGKHLPDYPNPDVREKVTLHHLLTHTSGIGDYFNEKFMEASRDRFRSVRDFFPLFADRAPTFTPGTDWSYSNAGFVVLGAVIEKVSGKSYFDYVREQVYRPAGMVDTDAYEMDVDTPNLATGYFRDESGQLRNNLYLHVIKGGPAGGGFSTVDDLFRFSRALLDGKLAAPSLVTTVTTGKVNTPMGRYAYGFSDLRIGGERIIGHGGGFPGISSQLDIYPDSGYTVVVLSNEDRGAPPVVNKVRRLLTGH